jgi:hypothetical protein
MAELNRDRCKEIGIKVRNNVQFIGKINGRKSMNTLTQKWKLNPRNKEA